MSEEEKVEEQIENTEEVTEDTPVVEETPEAKIERLEGEKVALEKRHESLMNDQSTLGRRYKDLQSGQTATDSRIAELEAQLRQVATPKEEGSGYLDMNDPAVAKKWFHEQARELMSEENRQQKAYEIQYEKNVRDLLEENEEMSADERKTIYDILETQKDNMFNDPLQDAQWNIEKSQLKMYKGIATGKVAKNPNIRQEKAVGTGVGGGGTVETTTKKKEVDSPEIAKLKETMAKVDKSRGW